MNMADLTLIDADVSERIAQIMSRWTASTPGEWITTADSPGSVYYGEVVAVHNQDDPDYGTMSHVLTVPELDDRPNDLIFAAEAHQDIPFLVSVISESMQRIAWLRKTIDKLENTMIYGREYARNTDAQLRERIAELEKQIITYNNPEVGQ